MKVNKFDRYEDLFCNVKVGQHFAAPTIDYRLVKVSDTSAKAYKADHTNMGVMYFDKRCQVRTLRTPR